MFYERKTNFSLVCASSITSPKTLKWALGKLKLESIFHDSQIFIIEKLFPLLLISRREENEATFLLSLKCKARAFERIVKNALFLMPVNGLIINKHLFFSVDK